MMQIKYEIPPEFLNNITFKINNKEIEKRIINEELYKQYKKENNTKNSLGFLFQMILKKMMIL